MIRKGSPSESLFSLHLWPQTIWPLRGGDAHFPTKTGLKNQNREISITPLISHDQSIDNSLRMLHAKFHRNWSDIAGTFKCLPNLPHNFASLFCIKTTCT